MYFYVVHSAKKVPVLNPQLPPTLTAKWHFYVSVLVCSSFYFAKIMPTTQAIWWWLWWGWRGSVDGKGDGVYRGPYAVCGGWQ